MGRKRMRRERRVGWEVGEEGKERVREGKDGRRERKGRRGEGKRKGEKTEKDGGKEKTVEKGEEGDGRGREGTGI